MALTGTIYRPLQGFDIATTTTNAVSPNAVPFGVQVARLKATGADVYVNLNAAAAAGTGMRLASTDPAQEIAVSNGDEINVIAATGTGTLNVTFMGR